MINGGWLERQCCHLNERSLIFWVFIFCGFGEARSGGWLAQVLCSMAYFVATIGDMLQDILSTFLFWYCFQAVVYAIWYESHTRSVGEAPQPAARLLIFLDKLVRNKISSLKKKTRNKYEKVMKIWFGCR